VQLLLEIRRNCRDGAWQSTPSLTS